MNQKLMQAIACGKVRSHSYRMSAYKRFVLSDRTCWALRLS
ncbi:hypothetical protein [uncultured Nostoc sp.]